MQERGIWKLLGGMLVTLGLFGLTPLAFQKLGVVHGFHTKTPLILLATGVGLLIKMVCSDLATGKFEYHKHGHDFCILTLGAALTSFSLQLLASGDLFPGLAEAPALFVFRQLFPADPIRQRLTMMFVVCMLASLLSVLTARVSMAIRNHPRAPKLLACLNFALGSLLFSVYVLLLVAKE